jgi:D-alanine-D-alanine ligase
MYAILENMSGDFKELAAILFDKTVSVLFNQLDMDEYVYLRAIDPSSLDFTPIYPIHVATPREEYDAIVNALRTEGFQVRGINLEDDFSKLNELITKDPPDVVFNLVESFHNNLNLEGSVAAFFDLFRVRYTGSSAFCLSLCRRKGLTKQILAESGVATPRFRMLDIPKIEPDHSLHYPLIVKPARQDGSAGVHVNSVVFDYAQLISRLECVFAEFKAPVLVEEFIDGRELHVSVLGNNPPRVLPIEEYNFSELPDGHPPLITYDIKWNPLSPAYHKVHSLCPAVIDQKTEELVKEHALRAFTATCCRDYARIDVRLGRDGVPYILEVNPNPDLTEGVSFMKSAEKAGLCFSETLRRIVTFAFERKSSALP